MKSLIICDGTNTKDVIELCKEYSSGIEVQAFCHPDALTNQDLINGTVKFISDIPVISMHGPFGDLNPGSFDPLVRQTAKQRIYEGASVGRRLNAKHLVFHTGRIPHAGPSKPWVERSIRFWKDFMQTIDHDINVYLENFLESGPDIAINIIDEANAPGLNVNLDIGHAHCISRMPVLGWITSLGSRIRYVHLHDNNGEHDEHLGLGKGNIPLNEVCHALEEYAPDAIWAIEAEGSGIDQSLEWLEENGFIKRNTA